MKKDRTFCPGDCLIFGKISFATHGSLLFSGIFPYSFGAKKKHRCQRQCDLARRFTVEEQSSYAVQTETQFNPTFQIVAIAVGDELGTITCL